MIEILKAILFGIVEGITEWLPISSTGHMILLGEFVKLNVSEAFKDMFIVVIQLGAIFAVVFAFWNRLFPFSFKKEENFIKKEIFTMWVKILIACIPAAVVGLLWEDTFERLFYNPQSVAIMLILFGIFIIIVENWNKKSESKINSINEITIQTALIIGVFQLIAAIFPGVSRSGATILGCILLGMRRTTAAEYTFFMAVPVMVGASLLNLIDFGFNYSQTELITLLTGFITAFLVSIVVIKFLIQYIKRNNFKVFGAYRIILGIIVLLYFWIR